MTNTVDPASGKEIRVTDNGLREKDYHDTPQHDRPLTADEIEQLKQEVLDHDKR